LTNGKINIEGLTGIYESPFKLDDTSLLTIKEISLESSDFENDFIKYYKNSVYPTQDEVRDIITNNNYKNILDINKSLYRENKFSITQKDIFKMVETGRIKRGVFYNLACRSSDDVIYNPTYRVFDANTGEMRPSNPVNIKEIIKSTDPNYNPYKPHSVKLRNIRELRTKNQGLLHPIIKQRISEAELQRKYLQKVKNNTRKGGLRSYRKSRRRPKNTT